MIPNGDLASLPIPDVFAQKPVLVYGKFSGAARGTVKLTGFTAGSIRVFRTNVSIEASIECSFFSGMPYSHEVDVAAAAAAAASQQDEREALRYLWARTRVQSLTDDSLVDYNGKEALQKQVEALGMQCLPCWD